jgi:hypothetical protein
MFEVLLLALKMVVATAIAAKVCDVASNEQVVA